jgi:serine/threonine protein kinase
VDLVVGGAIDAGVAPSTREAASMVTVAEDAAKTRRVGRYAIHDAIAAGGMATVHLGRLLGPVGFSRTVALKRLHKQFASDPEFVAMFLDEARLAARIQHPNVVTTLDVVASGGELFLVMEYVPGESVARISRALRERRETLPLHILSAIITGVLHGLHAAHEAKDERGQPLGIVHRDISPQNVLVGADGVARVLDFGVAKAAGRLQTTREGEIKGKLSYMPPEQLRGGVVERRSDVYAVGIMLWELVTGERLFSGVNEGAIVAKVLEARIETPSDVVMRSIDTKKTLDDRRRRQLLLLDPTILRALAASPEERFATAREMALEIERKLPPATGTEVADFLDGIVKDELSARAAVVAKIEQEQSDSQAAVIHSHVAGVVGASTNMSPRGQSAPHERTAEEDRAPPSDEISMSSAPTLPRQTNAVRPHAVAPLSKRRSPWVRTAGLVMAATVLVGTLVYGFEHRAMRRATTAVSAGTLASYPEGQARAQAIMQSASVAPSLPPASAIAPSVIALARPGSGAASTRASGNAAAVSAGAATSATARAVSAAAPATRATPSAPVARSDCDPGYYFDAKGVKIYKPNCPLN